MIWQTATGLNRKPACCVLWGRTLSRLMSKALFSRFFLPHYPPPLSECSIPTHTQCVDVSPSPSPSPPHRLPPPPPLSLSLMHSLFVSYRRQHSVCVSQKLRTYMYIIAFHINILTHTCAFLMYTIHSLTMYIYMYIMTNSVALLCTG